MVTSTHRWCGASERPRGLRARLHASARTWIRAALLLAALLASGCQHVPTEDEVAATMEQGGRIEIDGTLFESRPDQLLVSESLSFSNYFWVFSTASALVFLFAVSGVFGGPREPGCLVMSVVVGLPLTLYMAQGVTTQVAVFDFRNGQIRVETRYLGIAGPVEHFEVDDFDGVDAARYTVTNNEETSLVRRYEASSILLERAGGESIVELAAGAHSEDREKALGAVADRIQRQMRLYGFYNPDALAGHIEFGCVSAYPRRPALLPWWSFPSLAGLIWVFLARRRHRAKAGESDVA